MLKFSVRHGMVIDEVHEIISFRQSKWLEKYVNLSTIERSKAKNDLQKDFYKLLNIAFHGKAMENVRSGKNRFF